MGNKTLNIVTIIVYGILLMVCYLLSGDNPQNTITILEKRGYKNIHCQGYSLFLGTRDFNRTRFTATAPNGDEVHGAVTYTFNPNKADIIIKNP